MTWLKHQWQKWITRFSTEQKLLVGGQAKPLGVLSLRPQLLLGRDHCNYFSKDFSHVPRAKRNLALEHHLKLISPWSEPGHSVSWDEGFAQVWFWKRSELDVAGVSESGGALPFLNSLRVLPEAVFFESSSSDGVRLVEVERGYDLQYWLSGRLVASQWFALEPEEQKVRRFLRSQGANGSTDQVSCIGVDSRKSEPWAGLVGPAWSGLADQKKSLAIGLILVSIFVSSIQFTAVLRWLWVNHSYQQEIVELEETAKTILQARREARSAVVEANALSELFATPNSLYVQEKIYRKLPENFNLSLEKWERNFQQVDFTVIGAVSDTVSLVRSLSGDGIADVRVEPGRKTNSYRIQAQVENSHVFK